MRNFRPSLTFGQLIDSDVLLVSDGYRAKNEELGGDGPIFLRAGHVKDYHIDFTGVERFHSNLAPRLAQKMSRPGDVIVTTKGNSTGRVAYVTEDLPPFVYSPHLSFWRCVRPEHLNPEFLRHWSRSSEFRGQLVGLANSTDMAPYLSLADQRRLRITIPPPPEQLAIARVLGPLDDKIELNRRMNQTLEAMARAIFKSWFVDFEPVSAPELSPPARISSELGSIPQGWEAKPLDSIADFLNGLALQKFPPSDEGSMPVIKIADLRRGSTENSERAGLDVPDAYVVENGTVLFSWSGTLEVVVWTGGRGALNQHIFRVSSKRYPKWFYFYWLKEHLPSFRAIAADKATTMGHIQRRHLTQALVAVPPSNVLQAMDQTMAPLLEKQVQNSLESKTLTALRDTLLPKLLSGEIRVKQAEKIVGGAV